ncbi:MAG: hypothetical protein CMA63_01310 [Euryarchaeota archaeon]|nr:hypothetical protein [Euryarchaeota archaeon]|tara:strand:+ start:18585 stop:19442 length:858 start_codon:yes stop_codon:yes gene_type:complete
MARTPVIHLRGLQASLCRTTIERLVRTDATIVIPERYIHDERLRYADELAFGECQLLSSNAVTIESGHRILLFGTGPFNEDRDGDGAFALDGIEVVLVVPGHGLFEADGEWIDSTVSVYDLLAQSHDSVWDRPVLSQWLSSIQANSPAQLGPTDQYWWVSDIDVADALVRILMSDEAFPPTLKISGRRQWSGTQTIEELEMLFSRTQAGMSGQFSVEHLTSAPVPHIELQSLIVTDQPPMSVEENALVRPDLAPLHDVLARADGDGWRPLVPIRTALMHHLAGLF